MTLYSKILEKCLDHGINFYTSLPCSYNINILKDLIRLRDQNGTDHVNNFHYVPLVREESGVGLCAGASLGGANSAMILQNQGLGNMITQLIALNGTFDGSYALPNLYIISHRGIKGEKIQAQKPLGQKTKSILELADIKYASVQSTSELDTFERLLEQYDEGETVALLVKPNFNDPPSRMQSREKVKRRLDGCTIPDLKVETDMSRYHAISTIMNEVQEEYIISNIGHPSRELHDIEDRERNFYLTSSLGQAYMVALGFALSMEDYDEKVIGFEGDGGILMNASSLSLLANTMPENLVLVVLDNGVYGSTGNVETYASNMVNISALAQAYGIPKSKIRTVSDDKDLAQEMVHALNHKGPFLFHVITTDEYNEVPVIPYSVSQIKSRFKHSIPKKHS